MTDILEDRTYLSHILVRIQRIRAYTAAGREHFLDSELAQDAVIRNFEVIGIEVNLDSFEMQVRDILSALAPDAGQFGDHAQDR